MKSRFFKRTCIALFGVLTLYGLEMLAQGQTTGTGGGGGGGGSGISGGGGGSGISGGGGGSGISGGGSGMSGSNSASFSGGQQQGSFSGNATTTKTKGTGSKSTGAAIPSESNRFGPYYGNPISRGIKSTTGAAATTSFGVPIYAPTTTTTGKGTTATRGGKTSNASTTAEGFSTAGMDRAIPYVTEIDPDLVLPPRASPAFLADLRDIVQRSSVLKSKDKISVAINDGVVVLRGEVASVAERGLVERMLRMEPGVRDVSNEITVAGKGKQ